LQKSTSAVLPLPKDTFVHIKNRTISDLAYMNTVLVEEMGNVKDDIIKDFAETTKLNVKWKQNLSESKTIKSIRLVRLD
jgi:hypothetical protein